MFGVARLMRTFVYHAIAFSECKYNYYKINMCGDDGSQTFYFVLTCSPHTLNFLIPPVCQLFMVKQPMTVLCKLFICTYHIQATIQATRSTRNQTEQPFCVRVEQVLRLFLRLYRYIRMAFACIRSLNVFVYNFSFVNYYVVLL